MHSGARTRAPSRPCAVTARCSRPASASAMIACSRRRSEARSLVLGWRSNEPRPNALFMLRPAPCILVAALLVYGGAAVGEPAAPLRLVSPAPLDTPIGRQMEAAIAAVFKRIGVPYTLVAAPA